LRSLAIGVIVVLGISMLLPQTQVWLEKLFSAVANHLPQLSSKAGFWGGFIVGLSLGLIWAPCVGPILAAVITLAITSQVTVGAWLITLAYAVGTALPMFAVMYGGRALLQRVPALVTRAAQIQQGFGVLMIAVAVGMYFNVDRHFQTWVLATFPTYGAGLTKFEENAFITQQLEQLAGNSSPQPKGLAAPARAPQAPEITAGGSWLNTDHPLSLAELRGRVVLVDFWTYSCINCIRTLPYLRQWDQTYRDQGLTIIGVHSPEFAFEKVLSNVQKAVSDFQLQYPVVQDNDFAIWQAYQNRYWPAKYLIDAQGRVRYSHFGEGEYDKTEQVIQALLAEAGHPMAATASTTLVMPPIRADQTPETYLGYERAQQMANHSQLKKDAVQQYRLQSSLLRNQWQLGGWWEVDGEHAVATTGPGDETSSLYLSFRAKDVYVVMGAAQPTAVPVHVNDQAQWPGADVSPTGEVQVGAYRLYHVVAAPEYSTGVLKLTVPAGVQLFAFTFGS
jgi:thiol-disulfide isomerase/thioredoxin